MRTTMAAVSELIRRGLSTTSLRVTPGFPVFQAPTGAPVVTDEAVQAYRDDAAP